jgi:hypothetical protein
VTGGGDAGLNGGESGVDGRGMIIESDESNEHSSRRTHFIRLELVSNSIDPWSGPPWGCLSIGRWGREAVYETKRILIPY